MLLAHVSGAIHETDESTFMLRIQITSLTRLQSLYMSFIKGGGLFVPAASLTMGSEQFLLLQLPDSKLWHGVLTRVVWKTTASTQQSQEAGVGLQFIATQEDLNEKIVEQLAVLKSQAELSSEVDRR